MNIENINLAISMLHRIQKEYDSKHFDMNSYQTSFKGAGSYLYKENPYLINECGTACCFSGWISLSKEFSEYPDKVRGSISFRLFRLTDSDSIAELFGITRDLASVIIFPDTGDGIDDWNKVWGKYNFNVNKIHQPYEDNCVYEYEFDWSQIKIEHLIDILERIKSGELS